MSTFYKKKKCCAICGAESTFEVLGSTSSFGYMDLDTRPAPPQRFTASHGVDLCTGCYYANYELDELAFPDSERVMESARYGDILSDKEIPLYSKKFMLAALIYSAHEPMDAAMLWLRAAWLSDDDGNEVLAKKCRTESAECIKRHLRSAQDTDAAVMLADVLRRCGSFDAAAAHAKAMLPHAVQKIHKLILEYQIALCAARDDGCHSVGDVEEVRNG